MTPQDASHHAYAAQLFERKAGMEPRTPMEDRRITAIEEGVATILSLQSIYGHEDPVLPREVERVIEAAEQITRQAIAVDDIEVVDGVSESEIEAGIRAAEAFVNGNPMTDAARQAVIEAYGGAA